MGAGRLWRAGSHGPGHIGLDITRLTGMYGSFIRSIRRARGLSQRQLAAIAGVPQPNISAIERDRRMPSADSLNRLVVACGFELAAVAGEKVVHCPLPEVGWFPDEGLPGPEPGDPGDEAPVVGSDTPIDERLRVITAVLEAADHQVRVGR